MTVVMYSLVAERNRICSATWTGWSKTWGSNTETDRQTADCNTVNNLL